MVSQMIGFCVDKEPTLSIFSQLLN